MAAAIATIALLASPAGAGLPGEATAALVPAALEQQSPPSENQPPAANTEIGNRIEGAAGLVVHGAKLHGALLRQFYARHEYQPVWPTHERQAAALLAAVRRAGDQGLDPELFHAELLRNPASLAPLDRELLLSDAFLAYADALARGALPIEVRMDDEDLTPEPVDVAAALDAAIASPDPAAAIEALAPQSPEYLAMRRALQAYRAGAALPEPSARRGHEPRGAAAAAGNDARVREIEVNLERLRWLPRHLPADRVWVNLANAQLVLYRDDRPAFTTRVVIGETDKQTPEFRTTIDSVLFNPPWNVPTSIKVKEILPKLGSDPDYLARHHMVWRKGGGIQQEAGPHSALGRLKFEMTDRFDVYLHDTPERFLFSRDNRRRSHGCVRVENPRELASLLLQEPVAAIDKGIATNTTSRHMLRQPVPVFLVYQTAFIDSAGNVAFRPDVYERDEEIWQHLHPSAQAPIAQDQSANQRRG